MSFEPSTLTTPPAEWARVDAALDEILSLEPGQWPAAIDRLSHGDRALADELATLLEAALEGQRQFGAHPAAPPLGATDDADADARSGALRAARGRRLDRDALARAAQARPVAAWPPGRPSPAPTAAPRDAGRAQAAPRAGAWRLLLAALAGLVVAVLVRWLHG